MAEKCKYCDLLPTLEGYDGCLGTLPGDVMNACCGHGGHLEGAYIQYGYVDGDGQFCETGRLGDDAALAEFTRLGVGPPKPDTKSVA